VTIVPPQYLLSLSKAMLCAVGASDSNADCVAEALVGANLAGHDSHGIMKLPEYVRDIRQSALAAAADPVVLREDAGTAVVDGVGTFGQVGARFAADLAIRKARENGVATVAAARCHHTGRIGEWVERIAAARFVGIAMVSEAQRPFVLAPFGGSIGALATNPLACAVPRVVPNPPILLDFATSAAALGKLQVAREKAEQIPEGWATGVTGKPTQDPGQFFSGGVLLPFGGHKGYALSVIIQLLAVGLSGGDALPRTDRSSCIYFIAVDPARMRPMAEFERFVEETVVRLVSVPPAVEGGEVLLPGDPETRTRAERANGIPVPDATWRRIVGLAGDLGVDVTDAPE
jgi:LDH2 family malate/lactate/ureidoglycolate dehydrogenase